MDILTILIALIVFVLMLGMGATVELDEVKAHRKKPWPILVGFFSQYVIMPFVAWVIATLVYKSLSESEKEVIETPYADAEKNAESLRSGPAYMEDAYAIGTLLVGCMPGGSTSNLFIYYGKGDVGLSIMMTLASSIASFGMVPLVLMLYAPSFTTDAIKMDYVAVLQSTLIVLVPALIGLCIRNWWRIPEFAFRKPCSRVGCPRTCL